MTKHKQKKLIRNIAILAVGFVSGFAVVALVMNTTREPEPNTSDNWDITCTKAAGMAARQELKTLAAKPGAVAINNKCIAVPAQPKD